MHIEEERKGDVCIFRLEGDFNYQTKEPVRRRLLAAIQEGVFKFIFNFEKLAFLDSAALGLLIRGAKESYAMGMHVKITNANEKISHIISQAKLDMLIDLVDSEETALKDLAGKKS